MIWHDPCSRSLKDQGTQAASCSASQERAGLWGPGRLPEAGCVASVHPFLGLLSSTERRGTADGPDNLDNVVS